MVTTNQKLIIDTQKITRKEYKNNTKESYQITRDGTKRRRKEEKNNKNNQKTINKMAIST